MTTRSRLGLVLYLGLLATLMSLQVQAQPGSQSAAGLSSLAPTAEEFTPSDELVGSWMGCLKMPDRRIEHGCEKLEYSNESERAQVFSLYNPDGTLWWRASRIENDAYRERGVEYFEAKTKEGFEPLFSNGRDIVLRMVAESANWFKVEINERTQQTKFIHKADPAWSKTEWEFWLRLEVTLVLSNDQRLRDAPSGILVSSDDDRRPQIVTFIKTKGDWAYVVDTQPLTPNNERLHGWVRWREGRRILVGCFLNDRRAPTLRK